MSGGEHVPSRSLGRYGPTNPGYEVQHDALGPRLPAIHPSVPLDITTSPDVHRALPRALYPRRRGPVPARLTRTQVYAYSHASSAPKSSREDRTFAPPLRAPWHLSPDLSLTLNPQLNNHDLFNPIARLTFVRGGTNMRANVRMRQPIMVS